MTTNQSNSETETQEIVEEVTEDREISEIEDIELDTLEAYNEEKAKLEDEEGVEPAPEQEASPEQEGQAPEQEQSEEPNTEKLEPPASWKAEGKEWFYKQPVEAQQEIARRGKDLDNEMHAMKEERASYRQRYEPIDRALMPHRDRWHAKGISEDRAIMSLATADKMLEDDLVGGLDFLAKSRGTTIQEIADVIANGHESKIPSPQVAQTPQNVPYQQLADELQYLRSEVQEQKQAKVAEAQQAELADIHALRDEQDVAGRFLRPEMHDEAFAKEHIVPFYQNLKAQYPDQSPKELMEKAYTAVTGKAVTQQPLGLSSNNNIRSRNSGATRSVRGSAIASPKEAPQEVPDSVEETLLQDARALGFSV